MSAVGQGQAQAANINNSSAPSEQGSTRSSFMSHVRGFFNCSSLPKTLGIIASAVVITGGLLVAFAAAPLIGGVIVVAGAGIFGVAGVVAIVRCYRSRHSASDSPPAQEVTGRVNATFVSDEVGETDEANEPSTPENMQEEDQKSVSSNTPQAASADNTNLQDTDNAEDVPSGDKKSGIENPAFESDEEISGSGEEKAEK